MRLYAMRDSIAKLVGPVDMFTTNEAALRAMSKVKFPVNCKANDFELLMLGEIDVTTGAISVPCVFDKVADEVFFGLPEVIGTFPPEDIHE